jgi:hypothetical protein
MVGDRSSMKDAVDVVSVDIVSSLKKALRRGGTHRNAKVKQETLPNLCEYF